MFSSYQRRSSFCLVPFVQQFQFSVSSANFRVIRLNFFWNVPNATVTYKLRSQKLFIDMMGVFLTFSYSFSVVLMEGIHLIISRGAHEPLVTPSVYIHVILYVEIFTDICLGHIIFCVFLTLKLH